MDVEEDVVEDGPSSTDVAAAEDLQNALQKAPDVLASFPGEKGQAEILVELQEAAMKEAESAVVGKQPSASRKLPN